jgi:hypothetical protein
VISKKSTRSAAPAKAKPASAGAPIAPQPASKPKAVAKPAPKVTGKAEARPSVGRVSKPKAQTPEVMAPTPAPAAVPVVTDEDIRVRAYFLSLEHRARGGSDIDFWLVAERELRNGIKSNS